MKKNKLLAVLLALAMTLSLLPTAALATSNVASVNGTEYGTLNEALYAAVQAQTATIKLLDNVSGTENQYIEIASNLNISLDLNGFELKGINEGPFIKNYGTLTINDSSNGNGRIYTTNVNAQGRAAIANYGTLIINNGTFGDKNTDRSDANDVQRGNALRNYGTATINGGYFTACDNYTNDGYAYAIANGGGEYLQASLTINDATVYGKCNGLIAADSGILTVNGGTYTLGSGSETNLFYMVYTSGSGKADVKNGSFVRNVNNAYGFFYADDSSSIRVSNGSFTNSVGEKVVYIHGDVIATGGTFTADPTAYLATGCTATKNEETNTWTVADNRVAEVNGQKYVTLADALAAAENDQTVTLLKDVTLSDTLTINKSITLDGQGHKITGDVGGSESDKKSFISVQTDGAFTMKDCVIDPSAKVFANAAISIKAKGVVTIAGCSFGTDQSNGGYMYNGLEFSGNASYPMADGTTISGNTFYGGAFRHNCISFYRMTENATININDNNFVDLNWDTTNAVRMSNYGKATATVNMDGNSYSEHGTDSEAYKNWAGFFLFQNAGDGSGKDLTINVTNLNYQGTSKQLYVLYENITNETTPKVIGDSTVKNLKVANYGTNTISAAFVASVGGVYYTSLAEAVEAAEAGQTVTLLNDVTLANRVDVNKNLTIDLGGKTITTTETCGNGSAFNVTAGSVTIQNGSIVGVEGTSAGECDAITVRSGATATLKSLNVTIDSKNGACAYAFDGGKVIIESGTYTNSTNDTYQYNSNFKAMLVNQANVATQLIEIKGGTFVGQNPATGDDYGLCKTFIASGYRATKSGDNWVVSQIPSTPSEDGSSDGGGGGSTTTTPSKPTTSTETKPDGSTTTTESKPDGTVTESNTSKPVTGADGSTSQTTMETTTGKDGVTESKTETTTNKDGSGSATTETTVTKPDGTTTESKTETTINKDGSTASTTTATTTNKDGTVTESKTEATTSTVTNKDGSTTETKQETTTTSTGSKTESTTVTTVNKDGSSTATTTATTTDKAGTVTESKTESTTNKNGTTTEKTTTTETKANGTVTESKTETTINKDGSSKATTTETVTKADGTKVESKTTATTSLSTNKATGTVTETKKETTTTSDGVKSEGTTVTQIQKDGTVTSKETVKASDSTGTTATKTTTLDAKGNVTTAAEATVSAKAVTKAAKTGGAVTLPVEVTATKSASTAPTVAVSVPKTAESVKVELPVENVTPGTVAVIVNADGTEKIVSASVVTENGVALKLDGSATVKLVDNAKDFVDVPETNVFYNEISSLSARNIMIGVSTERFDLHNSVTLDQVANVAGRITGAVDVSDFNAGVAWGKDGGLKTGSTAATRGEVLKALYIAAGSPAVKDTSVLSRFKDASSIPADLAAIAAWAAQNGILKGNMDGTAALSANVTRGQACALAGRTMGTLA